jgi:hypothetical protein
MGRGNNWKEIIKQRSEDRNKRMNKEEEGKRRKRKGAGMRN